MTEPRKDSIEPRPEAVPLRFGELTEEQRKAGEQAIRLLRGMAREPGKAPAPQSTMHSYLPVIYREHRGNRVVLLDGARGSGKSALLITLLDAYSTALLEQRAPEDYSTWLSPSDRIVPVGLVDLQPLPASTNLLFHLLANLERVVEAMELRQDQPRLGTAAWNPGSENESASRKAWRNFVRVAASGWKDNLEARKGMLDAEAFAVEVEQGELQRLDIAKAFHEFMDALVADYRTWNHWQAGPPPLFLIAVDDADMNPDLTEPLLELVRKLWHPRLAFLLTGDTELFLRTLAPAPTTQPAARPLRPMLYAAPPTDDVDLRHRRLLSMDVYAKIIPLAHRCYLSELAPTQRLEKGPRLGSTFSKIQVLAPPLPPGRSTGTFADYFAEKSQALEALPNRLRALWEVADAMQPGGSALPSVSEAVARIWMLTVRSALVSTVLRERLEAMVQVDAVTHRLKLDTDVTVAWQVEPITQVNVPQGQLTFERPLHVEAFFDPRRDSKLPPNVTAALVLTANILADTGRGAGATVAPSGLAEPLLAHATLHSTSVEGPTTFAWPLPDWESFLDIDQLRREWETALVFSTPPDPHVVERMAKSFLKVVLDIGHGGGTGSSTSEQDDPFSWTVLADRLAHTARMQEGRERDRELADWALGRAGLLAAPESGLPAQVGNALLDALRVAFKKDWERVCQALRAARRQRIRLSFEQEQGRTQQPPSVAVFIQHVDHAFPDHQFRFRVEGVEDAAPSRDHVVNSLRTVLQGIYLPSLRNVLGEGRSDYSLAAYLTELRKQWLEKAPVWMLQQLRDQLEPFTRIRDAGASALERLWSTACATLDSPELTNELTLSQGSLVISEAHAQTLKERLGLMAEGDAVLSFSAPEQLQVHVHVLRGASKEFLQVSPNRPASRAMEAVLRMAYDHGQDHDVLTDQMLDIPVGWKGIKVIFKDGPSFNPWPVPRWLTLFEWEFLEQSWQEAMESALTASGIKEPSPDYRVIDGLAYWVISVCQDLRARKNSQQNLNLRPSTEDWKRLMRWRDIPKGMSQSRKELYQAWKERLPLLATPEAGLSYDAAFAILGRYSALRINKDDSVFMDKGDKLRKKLRRMRREWMLEAGVPEKSITKILARLDNAFPTHPWVQMVGPWDDSGPLPPG